MAEAADSSTVATATEKQGAVVAPSTAVFDAEVMRITAEAGVGSTTAMNGAHSGSLALAKVKRPDAGSHSQSPACKSSKSSWAGPYTGCSLASSNCSLLSCSHYYLRMKTLAVDTATVETNLVAWRS